jgi:hypothetical protein
LKSIAASKPVFTADHSSSSFGIVIILVRGLICSSVEAASSASAKRLGWKSLFSWCQGEAVSSWSSGVLPQLLSTM